MKAIIHVAAKHVVIGHCLTDRVPHFTPNRCCCAVPGNRGSEYNNSTDDQLSDAEKFYSDVSATNGGRVNMSKFLVTACAFGLLLSSAFAEEKSSDQQREESNQIGLQKMNWTRVVASGIKERIGFFYAVNPDCSASGDINIRITKQPEHGTAETAAATSFPNFERENIRYREPASGICTGR